MKTNVKDIKRSYEDQFVKLVAKGTRRAIWQTTGITFAASTALFAALCGWYHLNRMGELFPSDTSCKEDEI